MVLEAWIDKYFRDELKLNQLTNSKSFWIACVSSTTNVSSSSSWSFPSSTMTLVTCFPEPTLQEKIEDNEFQYQNCHSKLPFSPQTLIMVQLSNFSALQEFIIDKLYMTNLVMQDHTWTIWQMPVAPHRCPWGDPITFCPSFCPLTARMGD